MPDETVALKLEDPRVAEPPLAPPISTFIVRFWRDWSAAGPRWCCRVEHIQSGQSATVLRLDGLLNFIRRLGIMADNRNQPTPEK